LIPTPHQKTNKPIIVRRSYDEDDKYDEGDDEEEE
jgi:hypothetical protein